MDHRLFKRVSAASATQFVPLSLSLIPSFFSHSNNTSASSHSLPSVLTLALSLPPLLPPSLLLDACLHEGCRLEPQVDWEAQILEPNIKLTKSLWMTTSPPHVTGTSMTLFLCLSLPWNYFLFSWFFSFELCVVMQIAILRKKQSCFILLHVEWWQRWALLFYL